MLVFRPAIILEAPQRTSVHGPTFIRLLARLTDVDVPPPQSTLSVRLSEWIDWTRAVALSKALDGRPTAVGSRMATFDDDDEASYAHARTSLARTIASVNPLRAPIARDAAADAPAPVDFSAYRQHYLSMQRAMQTATGKLRGQLRDRLEALSPDMARLAEVDAMMEGVLSPRENKLLAAVPALLGRHFERLQQSTQHNNNEAWLQAFHRDMHGVLLAELDVRFLPIEGLLAALRTHPQGRHVQTSA
jgi:hypothetical protein